MAKVQIIAWATLSAALAATHVRLLAQEPGRPEAVAQVGHRRATRAVAFSPDGRWVASGSKDYTVKLWDVATGRLLRTLYGHGAAVNSLAVTPDGNIIASGSGTTYDIRFFQLLLKGGIAGREDEDTSIRLSDVNTGKQLRILSGHVLPVLALSFSPDGRTLTSVSSDSIKRWDTASGAQLSSIKVFSLPEVNAGTFMEGYLLSYPAMFKPSRAVYPWERRREAIFKNSAGDAVVSPNGAFAAVAQPGKNFRVFDVAAGKELTTVNSGARPESRTPVAFTPDAKSIAYETNEGEVGVYRVDGFKRVWRASIPKQTLGVHLGFTPDGARLAGSFTDSSGRWMKFWSINDGRELASFKTAKDENGTFVFGPKCESVATIASGPFNVIMRETKTGAVIRTLQPAQESAPQLNGATASDNAELTEKLKTLGFTQPAELQEAAEDIGEFSAKYRMGQSIAFTPDGKWLIQKQGSSPHLTTVLWDCTTGTRVLPPGPKKADLIGNPNYSPDGRFQIEPQYMSWGLTRASGNLFNVARGHDELAERVKLIETTTKAKVRIFDTGDARMPGLVPTWGFNPDSTRIAMTGFRRIHATGRIDEIYLFDSVTTKKLAEFPSVFDAQSGPVSALAVNASGTVIAAGHRDRINLFNSETGQLSASIPHYGGIAALAFRSDDGVLAALGNDGDLYLFDAPRRQLVATLVSVGTIQDDWLVSTPDGLFDGSPAGWNHLLWRFGGNTFDVAPAETFFNEFYYPGLLADVLSGKAPKASRSIAELDRRQPTIEIARAETPSSIASTRTVKLNLSVAEAPADNAHSKPGGVRDLRLFRNGSLIKVWHGEIGLGSDGRASFDTEVAVTAGENRFTAYAFNRDNIKSANTDLLIEGSETLKRKSVLRIIAVGIDVYANSQFNLRYAGADARDFAEELVRQEKQLDKSAEIETTLILDNDATKQNILEKLSELVKRSQPEDIVVLYIASHGAAQGSRFYLIPHDLGYDGERAQMSAGDFKTILDHSLSDLDLQQAVESLDSAQTVLVIDACHSGQALESEEKRRGPMNSRGLAQLAYEKGMYVLTAAQSYQAALEASQLGHGFLTYALVEEGLKKGAADFDPSDGVIFAREWLDYATQRVPQMQIDRLSAPGPARDLAFVEGEQVIADPSKRNVQRPRVYYRRESETQQWIVAKRP